MRLVCPRCGAHYEIDDTAIPAAGRDVECSACEHVWRAGRPATPFDPAARPSLSRPLSDDVIAILREEASRELEVRASERQAVRAAPRPDGLTPAAGDAALETAPPPERLAPAPAESWQATGDAAKDDPDQASGPSPAAGLADADPAQGADAAAGAALPDAGPAKTDLARADAAGMDAAGADRADAAAASRADAVGAAFADEDGAGPADPIGAGLPHVGAAARPAGDPPAAGRAALPDAPARAVPRAGQAVAPAPQPPRPAGAGQGRDRARARRSHDAGYHLAVMAALIAVALYAAAPGVADKGPVGATLMRWHAKVDEGRGWLDARADAALAMLGLR